MMNPLFRTVVYMGNSTTMYEKSYAQPFSKDVEDLRHQMEAQRLGESDESAIKIDVEILLCRALHPFKPYEKIETDV